MKQKYLLIAIIILLLIPISLLLFSIVSQHGPKKTPSFTSLPTVTPFPTLAQPLQVVSTNPVNNQTGVSTATQITITFDKSITVSVVPYNFVPETNLTTTATGNTFSFVPNGQLLPGTTYSIQLRLNGPTDYSHVYNFSFTTAGPTPTAKPDTQDKQLQNDEQNYERKYQTDVFLSNNTPYSSNSFSITNMFVPGNPSGHYQFIVTLLGNDRNLAKNNFINWLHSLQLTDNEIQSLDIVYQ